MSPVRPVAKQTYKVPKDHPRLYHYIYIYIYTYISIPLKKPFNGNLGLPGVSRASKKGLLEGTHEVPKRPHSM